MSRDIDLPKITYWVRNRIRLKTQLLQLFHVAHLFARDVPLHWKVYSNGPMERASWRWFWRNSSRKQRGLSTGRVATPMRPSASRDHTAAFLKKICISWDVSKMVNLTKRGLCYWRLLVWGLFRILRYWVTSIWSFGRGRWHLQTLFLL